MMNISNFIMNIVFIVNEMDQTKSSWIFCGISWLSSLRSLFNPAFFNDFRIYSIKRIFECSKWNFLNHLGERRCVHEVTINRCPTDTNNKIMIEDCLEYLPWQIFQIGTFESATWYISLNYNIFDIFQFFTTTLSAV